MALLDKVRKTLSSIGQKVDQNQSKPGIQLLPPISINRPNIQPVKQFFTPKTGTLATAGRQWAQELAARPLTQNQQKVAEVPIAAMRGVTSALTGFTGLENKIAPKLGLGTFTSIKPQYAPGKVAEVAGAIGGSLIPAAPINQLARLIKPVGAVRTAQKYLGSQAGKLIAQKGLTGIGGRALANVSQGIPFTAGFALAQKIGGQQYGGKQLAGDVGFDAAAGALIPGAAATLPLLMGITKNKADLSKVLKNEAGVMALIKRMSVLDKMGTAGYQQTKAMVQKAVDVLAPDLAKNRELNKLKDGINADEWMKTVTNVLQDRLVAAKTGDYTLAGMSTKAMGKLDTPKLSVEPVAQGGDLLSEARKRGFNDPNPEANKENLLIELENEYLAAKDKSISLVKNNLEGKNYKSDTEIPKSIKKQLDSAYSEMNKKFNEWQKYRNLAKSSAPAETRTQISSLEGNGSNPLTYKDNTNYSSDAQGGLGDMNRLDSILAHYKQFPSGVDIEAVKGDFRNNPQAIKAIEQAQKEVKVQAINASNLNKKQQAIYQKMSNAKTIGELRSAETELKSLSPSKGGVSDVTKEITAPVDSLTQKPETLKQLQQQAQTNVKTDSLSSPRVYTAEASPETMKKITMRQARDQKIQANKEYKEYQRAVFSQEGAKYTDKGNLTNQLKNIEKSIKSSTTPGGVKVDDLKDISGFKSYTRDVYRNFKEVYGKNYENIKRTLLDPFDKSKGDLTRAYKNWSDRISNEVEKGLQIKKGSKESAAVQLYGEGKMTEPELVSQFGAKKTEQIKKADQWFRKEYDKLLGEVNATMKRVYPNNPEKQIPKRADYYRHFTEMGQGISGLRNIFDNPSNISSSLAGTSEFTKPKSKWLSFAQKRLGDRSDVDAVGGFLDYIKAAEYNKNIDPHTAKFRALAEDLAMQTEKDPKLNNFIEYLNDFSGDLAGKTNPGDRFIQKVIPGGRKTMSVINWVNNRIKANVILGNASSTIAQIFNVPQGIADVGPKYATKGLGASIANIFGEKTPISKSNFITERYGGNAFDRFDRGLVNNGRKLAAWMTGVLDEVGTKYIWNAQYQKALGEGVQDAVKFADDRTRSLVAGRGIGEVPLIQKSKVFQLVAPFQLEVANLWHVIGDWVGEKQFGKLVTFMIASYAFNRGAEAIRGSDVSFDPIQASIEAYNAYSEEEDKKLGAMKAGGRIGGEILSNVPLGQSIAASYPEYGAKVGDTQLPTREEFFGKGDPTRFGSGLLLTKGVQDPLFKLIPPYGGQQLKRTIEGAIATEKGYSETKTGRVRFPTEDTPIRNLQRAVFGEYSTPNAREYFDSNTSTLGEKQSEVFKKLPKDQAKSYYEKIMENRKKDKAKKQSKVEESGVKKVSAAEETPQEITYVRSSDNSTQTIKLSNLQKPTGTTLKDYLSSGNRDATIREIYKAYAKGEIDQSTMNKAFSGAGVSVREAENLVIATLPTEQKAALVYDRLVSPQSQLKDLEELVSSKLLTTAVIKEMKDTGKINDQQESALKNYLKQKSGKVSKGKKPKKFKPTKFKAIKLKGAKKTYLKQKKLTLKDLLRK